MTQPAKHTPGPWAVNDSDTGMSDDGTIINLHGMVIVSSVYGQTTEIAAANAALIAAAPAMYEALQAMLDGILYTRGAPMTEDRWRTLTTIARQALAQAEGKQ